MIDNRRDDIRREDDRERWDQINRRVVSLTTSDLIQNDRLDALFEKVQELIVLLEGVSEDKNDNGIKGDLRELLVSIELLRRVLHIDITGKPGYDSIGRPGPLKQIEILWNQREQSEKKSQRYWKFIAPLLASIISGLIAKNWGWIAAYWHRPDTDVLAPLIEKAKHPKAPGKIYVKHVVSPKEEPKKDGE